MKARLGGVHHLVTGLNGAGKTQYIVGCILRYALDEVLTDPKGAPIRRRLCVSGIKGLTLDHEWIDCPAIDPERFEDKWRHLDREPGMPPLDVPHEVQSWWAWCQPGDIIVIDECQRVFRPMAAGRRVPMYIEKLETARHYGVQFLYITQQPNLIHTNVRSLIGPHQHVERILGGMRTVIFEWPVCTNPDRRKTATKRFWKHDPRIFQMYESSQLHTKFSARMPIAIPLFGLAVVGLAAAGVYLVPRLVNPGGKVEQAKPATPQATPQGGPAFSGASTPPGPFGSPRQGPRPLAVGPAVKDREPYAGFGVHIAGSWSVGPQLRAFFSLSIDGRIVATVKDADLNRAGYAVRYLGPCSAVLIFGQLERAIACDSPFVPPSEERRPSASPQEPKPVEVGA